VCTRLCFNDMVYLPKIKIIKVKIKNEKDFNRATYGPLVGSS